MNPMYVAIAVFAVAYAAIASDRFNKTQVALTAAAVLIIFQIITQTQAFHHLDMNVITLLISMMVLVKIIERTGVFEYLALFLAKKANGEPVLILVVFFVLTALLSALLDNITTVLLITPMALMVCKELDLDPIPFLTTLFIGSNIGGTATLIGDPPNIMIGSATHLTFMDFVVNLTPIILIQIVVFAAAFYLIFRRRLRVTNEARARIRDIDPRSVIKDPKLLRNSVIVFGCVLIGFAVHGLVDLETATIAIAGALVLTAVSHTSLERIFQEVEWTTIFFFTGLFIMVGALVETGAIRILSEEMLRFTGGDIKLTVQLTLWFSGIFSAVVDNIPFVATMIPLIQGMGDKLGHGAVTPVWWALSLGACLGGNGTLIGASANVVVADMARKAGYKITFLSYLKYGIPVMFASLAISYVYLMLRYF
jgi:Na+/H+ antiporter NhaD/arsenite permease-like protein